jgi:hypothetical protein
VLLAPVAFVQHTKSSLLRTLAALHTERCALPVLRSAEGARRVCELTELGVVFCFIARFVVFKHCVSYPAAGPICCTAFSTDCKHCRLVERFGVYSFLPGQVDDSLIFSQVHFK